jgi:hypothetical protein
MRSQVLTKAREIHERERLLAEQLKKGLSFAEALERIEKQS